MPDFILPYAKSWAALTVAILTGVSVATDLPQWLTIALAALSVVAVYGTPNTVHAPEPHAPEAGDGGPVGD